MYFFSLSDSQIFGGSGGYFQSIHGDSIMKSYGGCGGHFQAIRVNLTILICGSCGGLLGLTSTHTHIYIYHLVLTHYLSRVYNFSANPVSVNYYDFKPMA